MFCGG
ncbi:hypothetical protein YPPY42_2658, partial [Yersinia pestis PY-42]|jgi:4-alpha-glucanotransferase